MRETQNWNVWSKKWSIDVEHLYLFFFSPQNLTLSFEIQMETDFYRTPYIFPRISSCNFLASIGILHILYKIWYTRSSEEVLFLYFCLEPLLHHSRNSKWVSKVRLTELPISFWPFLTLQVRFCLTKEEIIYHQSKQFRTQEFQFDPTE